MPTRISTGSEERQQHHHKQLLTSSTSAQHAPHRRRHAPTIHAETMRERKGHDEGKRRYDDTTGHHDDGTSTLNVSNPEAAATTTLERPLSGLKDFEAHSLNVEGMTAMACSSRMAPLTLCFLGDFCFFWPQCWMLGYGVEDDENGNCGQLWHRNWNSIWQNEWRLWTTMAWQNELWMRKTMTWHPNFFAAKWLKDDDNYDLATGKHLEIVAYFIVKFISIWARSCNVRFARQSRQAWAKPGLPAPCREKNWRKRFKFNVWRLSL